LRPFYVGTGGLITIPFGEMMVLKNTHPSFQPEAKRRELQARLNEIPGISISDDKLDRFPSFRLALVSDPPVLRKFLSTMEWVFEEMKDYTAAATSVAPELSTGDGTNLTQKQRETG